MVIGLPREGLNPGFERDFQAFPPAGVLVFRRDFKDLDDLRRLTARLRELARPRRLFLAIDEEGGHVSQLKDLVTVPPNALTLARGGTPEDLEWIARVTGTRLRSLGIDWVFAPVADIHSRPANPVIGPRAYGTTPDVVSRNVAAVLRGFRASGAISCLKHFPGHGDTTTDSHLELPVHDGSLAELERRELEPFRANLDADAVMTAHVLYRALDREQPATRSRAITHDLLRTRLGFRGVTITDALEMKGAAAAGDPAEPARLALEAGCDLLLFAFWEPEVREARLALARALADGALDRANFDAARPRLAALDQAHPEPGEAELARPLAALTPPDWEERLAAIVGKALVIRGALPASAGTGAWRVVNAGPTTLPPLGAELRARGIAVEAPPLESPLAQDLARAGIPMAQGDDAALHVAVVATRRPLAPELMEQLRARCRAHPTLAVGLQNDAFLDDLPEARVTLSASDETALTRRVVAQALMELRAAAR